MHIVCMSVITMMRQRTLEPIWMVASFSLTPVLTLTKPDGILNFFILNFKYNQNTFGNKYLKYIIYSLIILD